jgi:hypothetical protein
VGGQERLGAVMNLLDRVVAHEPLQRPWIAVDAAFDPLLLKEGRQTVIHP